MEALRERARCRGGLEEGELLGTIGCRRVGEAGDAEARELRPDRRELRWLLRAEPLPQPAVEAEQATGAECEVTTF
jgi:hypothetical protein